MESKYIWLGSIPLRCAKALFSWLRSRISVSACSERNPRKIVFFRQIWCVFKSCSIFDHACAWLNDIWLAFLAATYNISPRLLSNELFSMHSRFTGLLLKLVAIALLKVSSHNLARL